MVTSSPDLPPDALARVHLAAAQAWAELQAKLAELLYEADFATDEHLIFPPLADFLGKCLEAYSDECAGAVSDVDEYRQDLYEVCYNLSRRLMPDDEVAGHYKRQLDYGFPISGAWFCAIEDACNALRARCDATGKLLRIPEEYEIGGDWELNDFERLRVRMEDYLNSLVPRMEVEFWKRQAEKGGAAVSEGSHEKGAEERHQAKTARKQLTDSEEQLRQKIAPIEFETRTDTELADSYHRKIMKELRQKQTRNAFIQVLKRIRKGCGHPSSADIKKIRSGALRSPVNNGQR